MYVHVYACIYAVEVVSLLRDSSDDLNRWPIAYLASLSTLLVVVVVVPRQHFSLPHFAVSWSLSAMARAENRRWGRSG